MKMTHFSLDKRLGQHFLKSRRPVEIMLNAAKKELPVDIVLEIGPGRGALTRSLTQVFPKIIAVEKDWRLAEELTRNLEIEKLRNCEIISGDILKVDIAALLGNHTYAVIANIPYYLTSRLIRVFLEAGRQPAYMILMVQEEVAERITAQEPHINLLALSVQAYGRPKIIGRVSRENFTPRPEVDSAVVEISHISRGLFINQKLDEKKFFQLLRAGFSQKRKTLANSLAVFYGGKKIAEEKIKTAGLSPKARPQELDLAAWLKLSAH